MVLNPFWLGMAIKEPALQYQSIKFEQRELFEIGWELHQGWVKMRLYGRHGSSAPIEIAHGIRREKDFARQDTKDWRMQGQPAGDNASSLIIRHPIIGCCCNFAYV